MQDKGQNISPIKQRILQFFGTLGISKRDFYTKTGISRGTLESKTGITEDVLTKFFATFPEVSIQWVMTGMGKMINLLDTEKDFTTKEGIDPDLVKTDPTAGGNYIPPTAPAMDDPNGNFDRIGSREGSSGLPLISNKANKDPYKPFERLINPPSEPEGIPLVSVKAVGGFAGKDFSIQERDIEAYYVIPKFRNLDVDFLIEVVGDSMMPRIFPGDIIACSVIHNARFIQWNKTYLISSDEQGMIVKRLKKSKEKDSLLAVSDNAEYDPFDIPLSDIKGLARVVGVIHAE